MKQGMKFAGAIVIVALLGMAFKAADNTEKKDKLNYFKGTYEEALAFAKKENKAIFLDAYTSWCGWCKELDKKTFSDEDFSSYMNENYVNVKMDMETPEGVKIGQKYKVSGYPTILVIHKNGDLAHRIVGFLQAPAMMKEVKHAEKELKRIDARD